MNRAAYCTLGCKVNQYDTDAMRSLMEHGGYTTVEFDSIADVYIVNTCTVTAVSDKKSRQMISRAHKLNPDAVIIVCGCYAQTSPDEVTKLPGVSAVLGTRDRADILKTVTDIRQNKAVSRAARIDTFEELSAVISSHTRAFLKIQDGCNRFCSYCAIPYARGRIASRSLESTRKELCRIGELGYREVVLTGIHLMSYGLDMGGEFDITDAIRIACEVEGIARVRLGSLEPEFVTDKFVSAVSENKKVCPQFHMSLQSGCDTVLKRMNRRYTSQQFSNAVDKLRAALPDCAITTDIIAGFAGETQEEHELTLDFINQIRFARVHAFPYSQRKGTPAATMPNQVPKAEKERRTGEIIALAHEHMSQYAEHFVGRVLPVLLEEPFGDNGMARGYTDTYIDTHVHGDIENCHNTFVDVKIESACDGVLSGCIIK